MSEIRSQMIDLGDGCRIHVLEGGTGQPVLLLHGLKFQAATWEELGTLSQLAGWGFRAIALDMPGFGRSAAHDLEPTAVLERLFRHLELDRPVILGPSMGGRIALEFAIERPADLLGLILVGPVGVEENRDRLTSIGVPTLAIWGSEDQISPPAHGRILEEALADVRVAVIEGAPHPCYLDQPDRFHQLVFDFLDDLTQANK